MALVIVYVVWGSTYLAIRIVVEEAPPLTSMGLRYSTAALVLGAVLMLRGGLRRLRINGRQAVGAAFLGLMLPLLGNGMVSVAEDRGATSGITALLIAITRPATVDKPPPPEVVQAARVRFGVGVGFYSVAFALSWVSPALALAVHGTMAAYYLTEQSSRLQT